MCGIVGVIRGLDKKDLYRRKDYFEQAIVVDCFRGMDSTGMMQVPDTDLAICNVFKKAMNPLDFIQLKTYKKLVDIHDAALLVGHNRFRTIGRVSDNDAHPFKYGDITLVHNGTLHNLHRLPTRPTDSFVDSAQVASSLNYVEDPLDILKLLEGSYALVWHDARTQQMHFARNDDRPFFFTFGGEWKKEMRKQGKSKKKKETDVFYDNGSMYFASERGMLSWLLSRNGIENGTVYYPRIEHLYSVPLEDAANFTVREYKHEPPKYASWNDRRDSPKGGAAAPQRLDHDQQTSSDGQKKTGSLSRKKTSTITKRDADKRERLRELGYSYEEPVYIEPIVWTPYAVNGKPPKEPYGYGLFTLDDTNAPPVEVHGITQTEYQFTEELGVVPAIVKAIREIGPGNTITPVILADLNWDEIKSYDWGTPPVPKEKALIKVGTYEPINEYLPAAFGIERSLKEWVRMVKDGCSNCSEACNPDYADMMLWHGESPLCHICSADPDVLKDLGVEK